MLPFRQRYTEDERRDEFARVKSKLDRFIPIIVEQGSGASPPIDKEKFLVPTEVTVAQLSFVIRKRLKMLPSEALFLMVNKQLCTGTSTMGCVYDRHHDPDGFLYVVYTNENTFG
jgi:GABA(A) receptor-associated protein